MAKKTVCDICSQEITDADEKPFDYRGQRLSIFAHIHRNGWKTADICRYCLSDAVQSQDDRPKKRENKDKMAQETAKEPAKQEPPDEVKP